MRASGTINHDGFQERAEDMSKKGYKVYGAAENVAYNYGADPQAAADKAVE